MWFSTPELVIIIIDGNTRVCCLITKNQNNIPVLIAFERIDYTNHEVGDGRIFNHLAIGNDIASFLKHHSIKNPFITFGFKPQAQHEKILFRAAQKISKDEFSFDVSDHHQHDVYHIGQTQDQLHLHYGCQLEHAALMQYKLITHLAGLNLTHLTTSTAALLHALSKKGLPAQKNAQENLSSYIKRCINGYTLGEQLCVSDILNSQVQENEELVLSCLGLFLLGSNRDGET